MGFLDDLKQGEDMELAVAKVMGEYTNTNIYKNPYKMGVDLLTEDSDVTYEVKYDRRVHETGNYAIEFECNGNESGICKTYGEDNRLPTYWVQSHSKGFEVYHTKDLYEFVKDNFDRKVKGGDGWRSHMFLIKRDKILKKSIKIFDFG